MIIFQDNAPERNKLTFAALNEGDFFKWRGHIYLKVNIPGRNAVVVETGAATNFLDSCQFIVERLRNPVLSYDGVDDY